MPMSTADKWEVAGSIATLVALALTLVDRHQQGQADSAAAASSDTGQAIQQTVLSTTPLDTSGGISAVTVDSSTGLEGFTVPTAQAQNVPALPTISGISIPDYSASDVTTAAPSPIAPAVGPVSIPTIMPTVPGTPQVDVAGLASAMNALSAGGQVMHLSVG